MYFDTSFDSNINSIIHLIPFDTGLKSKLVLHHSLYYFDEYPMRLSLINSSYDLKIVIQLHCFNRWLGEGVLVFNNVGTYIIIFKSVLHILLIQFSCKFLIFSYSFLTLTQAQILSFKMYA